MIQFMLVLIGAVIFATFGSVLLSLVSFEHNRIVNLNIRNLHVDFYTNRVKLFAVPVDVPSSIEFDKVTRLQWYKIRLEMLKFRKEIEDLEIRPIHLDLIMIGFFATCCVAIFIYSPALYLAEVRFGNEIEKALFNGAVSILLLSGTIIRMYAYFGVIKRNYDIITEKTRPIVERIGGIQMPQAIHFCYHAYTTQNVYAHDGDEDWHYFSKKTHLHMDRAAEVAFYCHYDLVDIFAMFFCFLSCTLHFWLFYQTSRWRRSELDYLRQMEDVENWRTIMESSAALVHSHPQISKQKTVVEGPNRKNHLSLGEKLKSMKPESAVRGNLMDESQLSELRDVYLSNYYLTHTPNRSGTSRRTLL